MKKIGYLLIIGGLVFADQATKFWAQHILEGDLAITSFFRLTFVENTGIAFSIPLNGLLVQVLTVLVLGYLFYQVFISVKKTLGTGVAPYLLVFSGALGNFIDRILVGKVSDFISFWSFPIFNVADILICIGVFLFLVEEFLSE